MRRKKEDFIIGQAGMGKDGTVALSPGGFLKNLRPRNITGILCKNKDRCVDKILKIIPLPGTIGFSGSRTLDQLGVIKRLKERGNRVYDPYKAGISRQESLDLRRSGSRAQYYLTSANAVSQEGELVFFSAYGNRISGISYAENVIVVCGINKLTADIHQALKRAREYATPLNCKRLNWQSSCLKDGVCREKACFSPEYKRMCCQILIIESEVSFGRMKVILVNEELGF